MLGCMGCSIPKHATFELNFTIIWYMPYLFTVVTVLATLLVFGALSHSDAVPRTPRKDASVVEVAEVGVTRLRAQQPVIVQRLVRGGSELRHANVTVTNVGATTATGVQVHLEQAGGVAYALRGPKKLAPRERGLYVLNTRVVAGPAGWTVVTRCTTCRR
jgi:hypothetical protein